MNPKHEDAQKVDLPFTLWLTGNPLDFVLTAGQTADITQIEAKDAKSVPHIPSGFPNPSQPHKNPGKEPQQFCQ